MMFDKAITIARSRKTGLRQLASLASDDLTRFFSDADFAGIDLSDQNLSGLDLSKARFEGVKANSLTKVDKEYRIQLFKAALKSLGVSVSDLSKFDIDVIVMTARAGRFEESAKIIENFLSNPTNKPPLFSDELILCEEIPLQVRINYYRRWAEEYISNPSSSIIWAVICSNFPKNSMDGELISDTADFLNRMVDEKYVDKYAHRTAMSYLHRIDTLELCEPVERFCNFNFDIDLKAIEQILNTWTYIPTIAAGMNSIAPRFILKSTSNRKIGELIGRVCDTLQESSDLFFAGCFWLSHNLKAEHSDQVLLSLLKMELSDGSLRTILLRWRRAKPKVSRERQLGDAILKWLSRTPSHAMNRDTQEKILGLAQGYLVRDRPS